MSRVERIGDATLYLGDCAEILPMLPKVDAVITDPPYGMNWNTDSTRFKSSEQIGPGKNWGAIHGDDEEFDPTPWLAFPKVILWGANHFGNRLPVGTTLVWVKKHDHLFGTFLSDAEIGWQKGGHGVYVCKASFPNASRLNENDGERAAHPTQKPLALMAWCIERLGKPSPILDPYMGSGTTGVAAMRLGCNFIGVEREPKYFDVACRRIEQAYAQRPLFAAEAPPPPEQGSFLEAA